MNYWMLYSLLFLSVLFLPAHARGEDWQKISDKDGVVTYQKHADESSSLVSFRGEKTVAATIESIISIMENNDTAHLWMPLVIERKVLKVVSGIERIELTHVGMPWPLTDRYFIASAVAERLSPEIMRVVVQSVKNPAEAWLDEKKILGAMHRSEFILTQKLGSKSTHVVLEINSDPKGSIPTILVNFTQRSWPQKFFNGLDMMLERAGLKATDKVAH